MFTDLSWSHMLLVLVVALLVVGPKDLPKVMRTMGQWAGKARAMADQFRKSFDEMARQSELDELRKELDELRNMRPLEASERAMNEALQAPTVSITPEQEAASQVASEADPKAPFTPPEHEPKPESSEPSEPIGDGHEPSAP
ncbi:MAG: twin-arginine translocase subunit TatB [Alphaproteobacteria bacterium]|nr:twin-arginine translocase subunit TatB [Alphaproteobacteria bacterium]MDE2265263.1 twin-arginine translocase subunit TatB [Alphaproteobacteria bacterium]MDE2500404.1 twin-arginine translocase subunit TatB [Alphaproteobacteria bacterium]